MTDWKAIAQALAAALIEVERYDDGCGCCSSGQVKDNDEVKNALAQFKAASDNGAMDKPCA